MNARLKRKVQNYGKKQIQADQKRYQPDLHTHGHLLRISGDRKPARTQSRRNIRFGTRCADVRCGHLRPLQRKAEDPAHPRRCRYASLARLARLQHPRRAQLRLHDRKSVPAFLALYALRLNK